MTMDLILISNEPEKGVAAQDAGVDRIMIDLEIRGKEARQGHLSTVISRHGEGDIAAMRRVLRSSRLLVRVNPLHDDTPREVQVSVDGGADIIMLPMFTTRREAADFIEVVGGRARTCLLLETPQAYVRADQILDCPGIDEVHVGLNDLHLGMGLTFMFELLACGVVERLAGLAARRGIKFGFGGVARVSGTGPLSPKLILSEHVRLGSSQVILSRDFQRVFEAPDGTAGAALAAEVRALREHVQALRQATPAQLEANARELRRVVWDLVERQPQARAAG